MNSYSGHLIKSINNHRLWKIVINHGMIKYFTTNIEHGSPLSKQSKLYPTELFIFVHHIEFYKFTAMISG